MSRAEGSQGGRGRIAITGLGVVCALGQGQRAFWGALTEGRNGIGRLDLFSADGCLSEVAGQVRGAIAGPGGAAPGGMAARGEAAARRRLSRTDRLCLLAADEAVAQAGLGGARGAGPLGGFGVSVGCSAAGMLEAERYCREGIASGFERQPISPVLALPTSAPADAMARAFGLAGPRLSNMTACASSTLSIGYAADLIRSGEADGMLAGGGDALCLMTYAGFNALRLLAPEPCRPFDASRSGMSLGEGAAILVMERWESAAARGATVLAEFLDYGATCDAHHMTAPHPEGRGAAAAMSLALARAGVEPDRVGHINAHGTGTPLNDAAEARAVASVFGADGAARVPITSTKSQVGHLLGGSGAIEAATLILSLRHQVVPPTLRWTRCDEGVALDVVAPGARRVAFGIGLSNSFGFGGTNASLAMARVA